MLLYVMLVLYKQIIDCVACSKHAGDDQRHARRSVRGRRQHTGGGRQRHVVSLHSHAPTAIRHARFRARAAGVRSGAGVDARQRAETRAHHSSSVGSVSMKMQTIDCITRRL
jgi:hypothetical protein